MSGLARCPLRQEPRLQEQSTPLLLDILITLSSGEPLPTTVGHGQQVAGWSIHTSHLLLPPVANTLLGPLAPSRTPTMLVRHGALPLPGTRPAITSRAHLLRHTAVLEPPMPHQEPLARMIRTPYRTHIVRCHRMVPVTTSSPSHPHPPTVPLRILQCILILLLLFPVLVIGHHPLLLTLGTHRLKQRCTPTVVYRQLRVSIHTPPVKDRKVTTVHNHQGQPEAITPTRLSQATATMDNRHLQPSNTRLRSPQGLDSQLVPRRAAIRPTTADNLSPLSSTKPAQVDNTHMVQATMVVNVARMRMLAEIANTLAVPMVQLVLRSLVPAPPRVSYGSLLPLSDAVLWRLARY